MNIQSFTFGPFQENTFVLYDETKECVIIDPGCYSASEQMKLSGFITENGLKPTYLLNTHCHVDHIAGNKYIADTYNLLPVFHRDDLPVLKSQLQVSTMYGLPCEPSPEPEQFISEGDQVKFGDSVLDIFHTPGHAPGHVVFYNKAKGVLINGDVLFSGSIGRTDLPLGDFDTLIKSITTKLLILPENTVVYCGHGFETTIGKEKRSNPFLQDYSGR